MKLFKRVIACGIAATGLSLLTLSGCDSDEVPAVEDGVFSNTCTFSIDLNYESELNLNPLVTVFMNLISDKEAKETLLNATSPDAYYDSRSIVFLTDGTYIISEVASDEMCEFNKLLSPTATKEELKAATYTVGGYRITSADEEGNYTITISGGSLQELSYSEEDKCVTLSGSFKEERYNYDSSKTVPEIKSSAEEKYSSIKSDCAIESKYLKMGEYSVASKTYREKEEETYFQYKVWYPEEMSGGDKKYPLIVMNNGTGTIDTAYEYVFEHLASLGFIVIGNDEGNCYSGLAAENSLWLMLELNDDSDSIFYGKVDTKNIGVAGHSQGGVGTINAVTAQPHGNMYKAVFTASTTEHALSESLGWPYDISKISAPYFAVAGTGTSDSESIAPLSSLEENYNAISGVDKIYARRQNADHGDMLTCADGYMTAWFCYHLKGDESAKAAFYGDNAEILSNNNWQDINKNI